LSVKIVDESINIPCEGIFWVIDDKVISFVDTVNINDPMFMTDLLHKNVWNEIKENYKVAGKVVSYDYFPRGRVETLFINNKFQSEVYMDKCIFYNKLVRSKIENDFRLYLPNVNVKYCGQLFLDGSHYICNKCK
jgi:hypothetical protein